MIRAVFGLALLGVALAGGLVYGVIRTVTDEVWPDW